MISKGAAALCVLAAAGCLDPADSPFPPPPAPPLYVTDSTPVSNETGVPTDVIVNVGFSDVPYPPDLPRAWLMTVASTRVTGSATVDLVDKRVRVRAARGLLPHTQYLLTLTTTLHSFAGAPLQETQKLTFVTGGGPGGPPALPPVRFLRGDVLPAFAASGCVPCHSYHDMIAAASGLDLATPEGVLAASGRQSELLGAPAIVSPGSHAQSYLMWKALGLAHTAGHQARDGVVMEHEAARVVADWIDQGAQDN